MITKKELYKLYIKDGLSSKQIASIKNIGSTTVLNYLKKYDIPTKPSGSQIKYIAINEYFDTWSNNMAYCLGFIAADGHVWKRRPYFTIGIHKDDVQVLNFIRDEVSPTSKVRPSKDQYQLCVYSKKIHSSLVRLGIDHKKTFNLKLPKIPKKYIPHFIRGFFDGDGSIWKTNFRSGGKDYYYANFISASKNILQDIRDYLGFGRLNKIKNKYYELKFCQSDCIKLFAIIYKEATFKLERKYNKFLLIDKQYHFWTKHEDDIIIEHLNERNTKQLISLLPQRNYKAIQARKNYLRKLHNDTSTNSKNSKNRHKTNSRH